MKKTDLDLLHYYGVSLSGQYAVAEFCRAKQQAQNDKSWDYAHLLHWLAGQDDNAARARYVGWLSVRVHRPQGDYD